MHEHFETDPAQLIEEQVRDYFLHVKIDKQWKPKTIRQSVASAKGFFVEVIGREQWQVFGQIRTKDHDDLPPVLSRDQVHDMLGKENKLWVRSGKGRQDRMVPLAIPMLEDLRAYWSFHCHCCCFPTRDAGNNTRKHCANACTAPLRRCPTVRCSDRF